MKSYITALLEEDGKCTISYRNEDYPMDNIYCSSYDIRPFYERTGRFSFDQLEGVLLEVFEWVNTLHRTSEEDEKPLFEPMRRLLRLKSDDTWLFSLAYYPDEDVDAHIDSASVSSLFSGSFETGIHPFDFVRAILSVNMLLTAYENIYVEKLYKINEFKED